MAAPPDALAPASGSAENAPCRNCGHRLPQPPDRYCGHCGQETRLRPPRLLEFVQQLGGAYLSTEGAIWRTLALLLWPGELTLRYLAGRRRHYVLPLRLYLTISLLTLLALRWAGPLNLQIGPKELQGIPDSPNLVIVEADGGVRAGLDHGSFYCEGFPAWICGPLRERLDLDPKAFARELKRWPDRFYSSWGTAMFLLLPVFAALYKLAHLRRGLFFTEHLVFALHVHSFWFAALALVALPVPWLSPLALIAMPVYGVVAARRVFGAGWWGTLGRAAFVAFVYALVLGIVLGSVALWSLLPG